MKAPTVLETWVSHDGTWKWEVLRKYARTPASDDKPFARWFCRVTTPYTEGELGDVYVRDVRANARRVR